MTAYDTVVVGTDGSKSSFAAVERAALVAAVCGAKLVVLCAYRPLGRSESMAAQDVLRDEAYHVMGSAPAEETLRTAREKAAVAGVIDVEAIAVEGDPVPNLLKAARKRGAGLIVVGNRGLNTLTGRILGSVPAEVARKADVDVLIVHTT
ncbi:universal stress protein [Streptomyces sp. NBC_01803]|uniref:universal stress protein n=1 Tax=Streptomyces sp. NBC_01803 TaxID=2975946 RepID=UPI002DDA1F4E|nr:universal stress protein [Streptomyces sp. NBC_01803]WSA43591.1 universal stress protein [Streptomyces sp. NBC_01803]